MTFAIDMVTNCSIIAVALFLAVNMESSRRTGIRTNIASPAHRTVATSGYGMTVALGGDTSSWVVLINYCDTKIFHQGVIRIVPSE